jgi:hypothetical protein
LLRHRSATLRLQHDRAAARLPGRVSADAVIKCARAVRYHSPVNGRPKFFRETEVKTNCDACGLFFDLVSGGVCDQCRRILCKNHLHGSFTQRLKADITGKSLCVQCRNAAR